MLTQAKAAALMTAMLGGEDGVGGDGDVRGDVGVGSERGLEYGLEVGGSWIDTVLAEVIYDDSVAGAVRSIILPSTQSINGL